MRRAPESCGGFDVGYVGDGRRRSKVWRTARFGSWDATTDVRVSDPGDGSFHEVEIVTNDEARLARVTLDGETTEPMWSPLIMTNDPLNTAGKSRASECAGSLLPAMAR